MTRGKVYLVGAGPGDERLVTLRAIEVLGQADCVIYDGLANPGLLRHARPEAEHISVRKRTGPRPATQDYVNALIVERARQGKTVVRLKGGDPGLFGRAQEEAAACIENGIAFEIVPGITAALAAAACAGIFLTDRQWASQVVFVTGREAENKSEPQLDYGFLARFDGTIVLYMAMGTLDRITAALVENGKAPDTPVAVIQHATTPHQRLLRSQLDRVAEACRDQGFAAPSIVIIGPVAAADERFNWFMSRPLFGKRIVITRDAAGNDLFASRLTAAGAIPVRFDGIEIVDCSDTAGEVLAQLGTFDWVIWTSANGVRHTFGALYRMGRDARVLGTARVACIGRQTADELERFGVRADMIPTRYTSRVLAEELTATHDMAGRRVVLLRSQIAGRDLADELSRAGAEVHDVGIYTVRPHRNPTDELITQIQDGRIDWITFTSTSTVEAFFAQVPLEVVQHAAVRIGSIGPVVTQHLQRMNLEPAVQADVHTIDGLVEALEDAS